MVNTVLPVVRQTFGSQVHVHCPEFERDITGLPMIERMAEVMFGGKS